MTLKKDEPEHDKLHAPEPLVKPAKAPVVSPLPAAMGTAAPAKPKTPLEKAKAGLTEAKVTGVEVREETDNLIYSAKGVDLFRRSGDRTNIYTMLHDFPDLQNHKGHPLGAGDIGHLTTPHDDAAACTARDLAAHLPKE